jgi:hypothetical protein
MYENYNRKIVLIGSGKIIIGIKVTYFIIINKILKYQIIYIVKKLLNFKN